jgi:hypothetical protein
MCLRVNYKKKICKNNFFGIHNATEERSRILSWIRIRLSDVRSSDTDPHQNVTDPQHCIRGSIKSAY